MNDAQSGAVGAYMDFTSNFWVGVGLAAALATALATAGAFLFSMWWRSVDAQRPEWVTYDTDVRWIAPGGDDVYEDPGTLPVLRATLSNASQGVALRMKVAAIGCAVEMQRLTEKPRVETIGLVPVFSPGTAVRVEVKCEPADWDAAALLLLWREPSLWRHKRRRRSCLIPLSDIASRPTYSMWVPMVDGSGSFLKATTEPEGRVFSGPRPRGPKLPTSSWRRSLLERRLRNEEG